MNLRGALTRRGALVLLGSLAGNDSWEQNIHAASNGTALLGGACESGFEALSRRRACQASGAKLDSHDMMLELDRQDLSEEGTTSDRNAVFARW